MSRRKIPWDLLFFSLVVVGGFGFSLSRIIQLNSEGESFIRRSYSGDVSAVPSLPVEDSEEVPVIDMGCLNQGESSKSFANANGVIRLKAQVCGKRVVVKDVVVKNISNGYQGTIFNGDLASFSTDYLVLQTGKNLIEIGWVDKEGPHKFTAIVYQK